MNKKMLFVILILTLTVLLVPFTYSQTIEEVNFERLGQYNFTVEKNNNVCKTIEFDALESQENSSSVLQLKIDSFIPVTEDVNISVYLNDKYQSSKYGKEISENNVFYLNDLKQNNKLEICVDNNFIPKLKISKNSTIGNYLLAKIKEDNFYQMAPQTAHTNKLIPIKVYVTNSGYSDLRIEISNATDKYIKNSDLDNVSGDVSFEGIVSAGETKKIEYYIKTTEESTFISPRAILKYTNEFGKNITRLTEPTIIELTESTDVLTSYIDIKREMLTGQEIKGKIILRNTYHNDLENIYITPNFTGDITLEETEISKLKSMDIKEIEFSLKTFEEKEYPLSFNIHYETNQGMAQIKSSTIDINSVKEDNASTKVLAILITLTVILFIWFVKF